MRARRLARADCGVHVIDNLLLEDVRKVMLDVFDLDELTISKETVAQDVPDWDSLSYIRLIVAIEKRFHIRFTSAEIEGFGNVGALVKLIADKSSKTN